MTDVLRIAHPQNCPPYGNSRVGICEGNRPFVMKIVWTFSYRPEVLHQSGLWHIGAAPPSSPPPPAWSWSCLQGWDSQPSCGARRATSRTWQGQGRQGGGGDGLRARTRPTLSSSRWLRHNQTLCDFTELFFKCSSCVRDFPYNIIGILNWPDITKIDDILAFLLNHCDHLMMIIITITKVNCAKIIAQICNV